MSNNHDSSLYNLIIWTGTSKDSKVAWPFRIIMIMQSVWEKVMLLSRTVPAGQNASIWYDHVINLMMEFSPVEQDMNIISITREEIPI